MLCSCRGGGGGGGGGGPVVVVVVAVAVAVDKMQESRVVIISCHPPDITIIKNSMLLEPMVTNNHERWQGCSPPSHVF